MSHNDDNENKEFPEFLHNPAPADIPEEDHSPREDVNVAPPAYVAEERIDGQYSPEPPIYQAEPPVQPEPMAQAEPPVQPTPPAPAMHSAPQPQPQPQYPPVNQPMNAQPFEYAPGQEYAAPASMPNQPQAAPEWGMRWRGEVPATEWHEPSYSEPGESTDGMYTPGIRVNQHQQYSRKRRHEHGQEKRPGARSGRVGRFVRVVCLILVCALFSGAAAYGVLEYRLNRGDFDTTVNQVVLGGTGPSTSQGGLPTVITSGGDDITATDIYEMALSQVVGITTEVPGVSGFAGASSNPITGSGFIISADGYLLTNYHVIESAQLGNLPVSVIFSDGTEFDAKIIGYDISSDVALLKVEATGLHPAMIANSDNIRVGQPIYAVGNPFGDLVYTMTDGIISALDRAVTVDSKIISTFQFSAAVNPGNSGGPIYDANGEVIGIVTAKLMRGSVEGIGFAIPINDAIEIASGLIEHGYIAGRPFLGITPQTVRSEHADYFRWGVVGVYIVGVIPDSAAETAGLMVGDIITALNDTEIDSVETLRFTLRKYRAGDTATLTVWRSEESIEITITFDEDLSAGQPQTPQPAPEEEAPGRATPRP